MSDELSRLTIQRLVRLSYGKIDSLRSLESKEQVNSVEELRGALDEFFREVAKLAYSRKGVQFRGDPKQFGQTRQFANSQGWLTDAESRFVGSFYGLLSEILHKGDSQSKLDLQVAGQLCWYIFELVSSRIEASPKMRSRPRPSIPADYFVIARSFLQGMRKKRYRGRAFEMSFDRDLMEMTRKMIGKRDIPCLFEMLTDSKVSAELRNRAASLMIAPCLNKDETLRANTVQQMSRFYWDNRAGAPWLVLRGVALALSNRTNNPDCILDYLEFIQTNNLTDDNLAVTDGYYPDQSAAVEYYVGRLNDPSVTSTGCTWEIFYVSKRAKVGDKTILAVLERRRRMTEDTRIKQLCSDAISGLQRAG